MKITLFCNLQGYSAVGSGIPDGSCGSVQHPVVSMERSLASRPRSPDLLAHTLAAISPHVRVRSGQTTEPVPYLVGADR